jgi:CheY-like chemotaxis protein
MLTRESLMQGVSQLLQALTGLLWPIIVGLLAWRLLPVIRQLVSSRGFTVKVGGVEVSVQDLADKLVKSTAELQAKGVETSLPDVISRVSGERLSGGGVEARDVIKKILWVDDNPGNNAYESAQLQSLGVSVETALSTEEALGLLTKREVSYDAVISDMGRNERSGAYNPNAGIDLIRSVRSRELSIPIIIYAGHRSLARRDEVIAAGGAGITDSPSSLFDLLRRQGDFPGSRRSPPN